MLPPEERRLQTLERILRAPEAFPPTAWLCAPPDTTRWAPESPAAVLLTAVAGQAVPAPHGLPQQPVHEQLYFIHEHGARQAVRAGGLTPPEALSHFRRHFSHFTLEAAKHIMAKAFFNSQ